MVFTLRSCLYSSAAVGAFGAAREPGKWISAASDCIKVTPDKQDDWAKHDFTYPSNYANTCNQAGQEPGSYHCTWKQGMKAKHAFANGGTYNSKWDSEDWCSKKFCWVDPCACDKTDISKSTWLNSHYSYSMCGATDTYTPAKCSTNTDATACNAATGCKWATTCTAQTGTEAMVALRTKMSCTNPAVVPTGCACKANGVAKTSCTTANKKLWNGAVNMKSLGKWGGAANTCIKVTPDKQDDWAKHDFTYPANYANFCSQAGKEPGSYHCTWVTNKKAQHAFAVGGTYNSKWDSENWCAKKFCWVDPCACDKTDISKSTWLNGHYSYSMCGATDTYTPAKCSTNTAAAACNAATGCKWATTCIAQTGTEAMVALRTKMSCTNPAVVPVGCACKANTETQIKCNVANTKLWSPTITTPTATSTNSGHANSDHADTSDATKIKIGTMTALLLLALPK